VLLLLLLLAINIRRDLVLNAFHSKYTYRDSDVISMTAGFRRHFMGKTLINVFHCDIAEVRFFSAS